MMRRSTDTGKGKGGVWGKRDEWTYEREPAMEEELEATASEGEVFEQSNREA